MHLADGVCKVSGSPQIARAQEAAPGLVWLLVPATALYLPTYEQLKNRVTMAA